MAAHYETWWWVNDYFVVTRFYRLSFIAVDGAWPVRRQPRARVGEIQRGDPGMVGGESRWISQLRWQVDPSPRQPTILSLLLESVGTTGWTSEWFFAATWLTMVGNGWWLMKQPVTIDWNFMVNNEIGGKCNGRFTISNIFSSSESWTRNMHTVDSC